MIEPRTLPVEINWIGNNPLIVEVDRDIVNIVKAMNRFPGIRTIESCQGHGESPVRIWFKPESEADLPPLLYYFDKCHSGVTWPVHIYTDCCANRVTYMVKSEKTGPAAYMEGDQIAHHMNEDNDFNEMRIEPSAPVVDRRTDEGYQEGF